MSDLERIEARHSPAIDGQTCRVCDYSPEPPEPCDVVKLARALASAISNFRALEVDGDARAYEAVLHEVAGGDDGE